MDTSEFELWRTGTEYRWQLVTDHEVSAFGEGQRTKAAALRSIEAVKRLIADAAIRDRTGEEAATG